MVNLDLKLIEPNDSNVNKFMSKVKFFDHAGCWLWNETLDKNRYGKIRYGKKRYRAHRVSYYFANGKFNQDLLVCHRCDNPTCDNPTCVNPAHLFLGTVLDNTRDMIKKGRKSEQKRTHCPQGHEYSETNTRICNGKRGCKECHRIKNRTRDAYLRKNNLRNIKKIICKNGHSLSPENVTSFINKFGSKRRICLSCVEQRRQKRKLNAQTTN